MSSIEDFNKLECELIPAAMVNAYVLPKLNPLDTSELIIESSWGEEGVGLTPAVKKAETVTHLKLSPVDTPLYLEYDNEAGERDCIYGDELAQIISIMKLKDVDDTEAPTDGDALVYDGNTGKFVVYPLVPTIEDLQTRLASAEIAISNLQTVVTGLQETVRQILEMLTPPSDAPRNVKLAWSNINEYSDSSNTGSKNSGIYSHQLSENRTNDLRAA